MLIVLKKNEIFREEKMILDLKKFYEVEVSKYFREIGGEKFCIIDVDLFNVMGDDEKVLRSIIDLSLGGDPDIRIIG